MKNSKLFRLVVIGASSGGRKAVMEVLENIPKDINAAFLVVLHSSFDAPSNFAEQLKGKIKLEPVEAEHQMKIRPGKVYIAIPNKHLFVHDEMMLLSTGPRENLFRPAIDVLFRSAAVAYKNKVIGILLTGRLNDGTSGLEAIKQCGGLAIIQNPATAEFADMPRNAQEVVDIDYVVNLDDMGNVVTDLTSEKLPRECEVPTKLKKENSIATKIRSEIEMEESIGHQVPISCSSCGGPLWEMEKTGIKRYRCHVGHSFTEEALLKSQNESIEEALWIAIRTLEEKRMLIKRMAEQYEKTGSESLAKSYKDKLGEMTVQVNKLRGVLQIND